MRKFPAQYTLKPDDVLYFSHIPKTAGMTFRTILEDQFHCDEVCPGTLTTQFADYSPTELESYRLFRGHLAYVNIPNLVPNKTVVNVNVLREPISRVVSHYEYIRRMPGDPHYTAVQSMTLEQFAQGLPLGRVGKNVQTYYIAKLLKFDLNQLSPQEVLELAKESLDQLAFVGLLDCFQDSLFLLSYIFGWKPILNSRRENSASSESKSKLYQQIPQSTLDLIRENTLLDLELYEYAKDIFKTRFQQMVEDLTAKYSSRANGGDSSSLVGDRLPLSTAQLQDLLERHYEHRYVEQHGPFADTIHYDFREALRGHGWHRREYLGSDSAYRWIGPEPAATIDLSIAAESDVKVELQAICTYATTVEILDSLTLSIGEEAIPLVTLYSDRLAGIRLFQGTIPLSTIKRSGVFTRLTLRVNSTVALTQVNPDSRDSRVVGIAINYTRVFPVAAEHQESSALSLFQVEDWEKTAVFVETHLHPSETVIAPLAFHLRLPVPMQDYQTMSVDSPEVQWAILYKGTNIKFKPILLKLITHRFAPVFANSSFVVFSRRKDLPSLSYLTSHVRSFYWDLFQPLVAIKHKVKHLNASIRGRFRPEE